MFLLSGFFGTTSRRDYKPEKNKKNCPLIHKEVSVISLFISLPTFFIGRSCLGLIYFLTLTHMKTVMAAKSTQDSSSSKRHFHWSNKISNEEEAVNSTPSSLKPSSNSSTSEEKRENPKPTADAIILRKKLQAVVAVSRLRSVLALGKNRAHLPNGLGPKVIGTLFGYRRGHVHFAFQKYPSSQPAFLIELSTPISGLVKEMASGLVRIALECDKKEENSKKTLTRLVEEPVWRASCNGKKCGFATRRECGEKEWKILKAVEPISMGVGVLPPATEDKVVGEEGDQSDGEIMYMRAKFERVVGSRDSEAFYMMNPDTNGAPELSVYLLRV